MKQSYLLIVWLSLVVPLSASAQFGEMQTITHDGLQRSFRFFVPANYTPGVPAALIFNLHGLNSNALEQVLYSGFHTRADTGNAFVVYPDAVNEAWNVGLPQSAGVDDVGFISTLIDSMSAWYTIDPARVYSTGMSLGGFMTYQLACELPDRIAAIASVTGLMSDSLFNNCQPGRSIPVLQVHGTLDATVFFDGLPTVYPSVEETVDFWTQSNMCLPVPDTIDFPNTSTIDGTTVRLFHYQNCADSTEVLFFQVNNGGHTWPGAFPIPTLGFTNQDMDASDEIWAFFNRHRHPSPMPTPVEPALSKPSVRVFPNPVADQFEIMWTGRTVRRIELFDDLGRSVMSHSVSRSASGFSNRLEWDVSALKSGLYLLRIESNHQVETIKIAKLQP